MSTDHAPPAPRPFEIVLFGATGFTGKLVAEYLARARVDGLAWALAGRNREKLEAVRAEIAGIDPRLADLPILLGDSADDASLAAIAEKARVVCTTVGPYSKYGRGLIAACAAAGTHYCDLTGEVLFMRDAIDRCDARARETGARLVPGCGFDSIPSDLGVLVLADHFKRQGRQIAWAKLYVERMKGGASGGTIASLLHFFAEASGNRELRRLAADPYALLPDRDRDRGPDGRDQLDIRWDRDAGAWTGPFLMASVNTRVVRRSNALLDFAWGRDFRYAEVSSYGRGPRGLARATAMTLPLGALAVLGSRRFTRELLAKRLPAPGEGPSKEQRERGSFRMRIRGGSLPEGNSPGARASALVELDKDPGYAGTAVMLGESALCLARDELPAGGGVLTPASSMGMALASRLRRAGMRIEAEDA